MNPRRQVAPWWFVAIVVIAALPVFSTPWMLSLCNPADATMKTYIWLYPVAIVASAYYCIVSYCPRRLLAWIMLVFMVLIDASMFYLTLA